MPDPDVAGAAERYGKHLACENSDMPQDSPYNYWSHSFRQWLTDYDMMNTDGNLLARAYVEQRKGKVTHAS